DTAYLGVGRRRLAAAVMAVPKSVGCAKSLEAFRYETLLHLLRCRQLRLISVWHPSFVTLLLDAQPSLWKKLITEVDDGAGSVPHNPRRAKELRDSDPRKAETLWPDLRVISC